MGREVGEMVDWVWIYRGAIVCLKGVGGGEGAGPCSPCSCSTRHLCWRSRFRGCRPRKKRRLPGRGGRAEWSASGGLS